VELSALSLLKTIAELRGKRKKQNAIEREVKQNSRNRNIIKRNKMAELSHCVILLRPMLGY